jgi:hypothetical protein
MNNTLIKKGAQTMKQFNVYLDGKLIDSIYYIANDKITRDEVRLSLIEHDGYNPSIKVVKVL